MPTLAGLKNRLWALRWRVCAPARLVYANGGIGDELMLTAIAATARAAGRPLHVLAAYPALWQHNIDPASLQTGVERWFYAKRRGWIATEIVHLAYHNGMRRHIAEQMAERAGVTLPPDWRPVIAAVRPQPRDPRLIIVQNSCRGARYVSPTKEWAQERWAELVRRLAPEYQLVQLGTELDPPLALAEDRRGHTALLEAAQLLARARLFIGLESGLQHVAAATRTPAVIIYGGRSRPYETGYAFNRNLTRSPACAGCGLNSDCPHGMICMDIAVDEVEAQVRAALLAAPV